MKKNNFIDEEVEKIMYWKKKIFDDFGVEIPLLSCDSSVKLQKQYMRLKKERTANIDDFEDMIKEAFPDLYDD